MPADAVAGQNKPIAAESKQGLLALGKYLYESGYRYTAVTPATHEVVNQRNSGQRAMDLRDILGWSRPFSRTDVSEYEFKLMDEAGILVHEGDAQESDGREVGERKENLWRSTLRWSSLGNLLCAHSAYPTDASDAVFFGPDTYRFARLIESWLGASTPQISRAVDIGCGSGAGALLLGRAIPTAQVLAVDINPRALRLTEINASLAGTPNVSAVNSNLLRDVDGDFDLIISNPPYMLDAQERAYRHGGGELGAGLSLQIFESALSRLSPGGSLLLYTGVAITDGHDPFLEALQARLPHGQYHWRYQELDPDVFGEELNKAAYANVERIAAVGLTVTRAPV